MLQSFKSLFELGGAILREGGYLAPSDKFWRVLARVAPGICTHAKLKAVHLLQGYTLKKGAWINDDLTQWPQRGTCLTLL